MRALVVEAGSDRGALAVSRALAVTGWTVGVASTRRRGLAETSRSVAHSHRVTPPHLGLDEFSAGVARAVRTGDYNLVIPGASDAVLMALSARRSEIPALFPYPHHDTLVRTMDRLELAREGERAGLAVPRTVPADAAALRTMESPAVVKQRLHANFATGHATRVEARIVASRHEAEEQVAAVRSAGGEPILQEAVTGPLLALALVADRGGRIIASTQQVSERTWPATAGVSARARTVPVNPQLAERVTALLGRVGWYGLAQLQFIAQEPDGEPMLIDFNGRPYGSLALAVAAGVNLPQIWAAIATGQPPPVAQAARVGTRYQWLEGDLRSCLSERGRRLLSIADCFRYAGGTAHSIWDRRDPRPAARYLRLRAAGALRARRAST